MLTHAVVAALVCFASVIDAAPQRGNGNGNGNGNGWGGQSTTTRCYTAMGRNAPRGGVSTTSSTSTVPCTSTKTNTVTNTVTPAPSTSVVTTTVTTTSTAPTTVLTSSTTVTSTVTTTTDTTTTATSTETSTVLAVSTVSNGAGPTFTPIQSSLPGSTYSGSGGGSPANKRDVVDVNVLKRAAFEARANRGRMGRDSSDNKAQAVTCVAYPTASRCATTSVASTTTVTGTTRTTTSTSTSTVTSTVVPSATTTITSTAISTVTNTNTITATTTTTTTTTSFTATTTVQAACATNNFADQVNGRAIAFGDRPGSYGVTVLDAASAYDCCTSANALTNGEIWVYINGANQCQIGTNDSGTCPNPAREWSVGTSDGAISSTWGNTSCGKFTSST